MFWKIRDQSHPASCDTFQSSAAPPNEAQAYLPYVHADPLEVPAHTGLRSNASHLQLSGKTGSVVFRTKVIYCFRKAMWLMSMLIRSGVATRQTGLRPLLAAGFGVHTRVHLPEFQPSPALLPLFCIHRITL